MDEGMNIKNTSEEDQMVDDSLDANSIVNIVDEESSQKSFVDDAHLKESHIDSHCNSTPNLIVNLKNLLVMIEHFTNPCELEIVVTANVISEN